MLTSLEGLNKNLSETTKESLFKIVVELYEKIEKLEKDNESLIQENKILKEENKELKRRLNMNSNNSSKPPSDDKHNKKWDTKSLRKKSKKKSWWQVWHKWNTLKKSETPDEIIDIPIDCCEYCGHNLEGLSKEGIVTRQEIDIPEPMYIVKEYVWGEKTCPCCNNATTAKFPEHINTHVQIGPHIKSTVVYLNNHGMVTYDRISEFFEEIYWLRITKWSLVKYNKIAYERLETIEKSVKEALINQEVINNDETWIRVNGKTNRLHVASSELYTYYMLHAKRWIDAMNDMWILSNFRWISIHDHLWAYNNFTNCDHWFCNEHHLRELLGVIENEDVKRANKMSILLRSMKHIRDIAKDKWKEKLSEKVLNLLHSRYQEILREWEKEYPPKVRSPGKISNT